MASVFGSGGGGGGGGGGGASFGTAFVGGLQASLTVLLVIGYGVIAAQLDILKDGSAKDISRLCVKIFLPALLLVNVGEEVNADNAWQYVPILVWSFVYTLSSMALGRVVTRAFGFPSWCTPAVAFNNTTSLPLVLIQSLESTGILKSLLKDENDTTADAINRAKTFFLVCSLVCNALTFAMGPKLLDGEEPPDRKVDGADAKTDGNAPGGGRQAEDDAERGEQESGGQLDQDGAAANEHTSLLPDAVNHHVYKVSGVGQARFNDVWVRLPNRVQQLLAFLSDFLVAPVVGALIGAIIGFSPALRRLFFAPYPEGGYMTAWLTSSVKNVGNLFAALQLVVVGTKLSTSLRRMKEDKASGAVPRAPMLFVWAVRFVLWPLISIPVIWALASKTSVLGNDPMLWFCLMLMPTGPPAIKLTALADVNGSSEHEKMSIAKFLTASYCVSPVICFAVVGALRASQAAMGS